MGFKLMPDSYAGTIFSEGAFSGKSSGVHTEVCLHFLNQLKTRYEFGYNE